ncbi:MAG: hypothetical protein AAF386_09115 [Pseudomonadota bacterium]
MQKAGFILGLVVGGVLAVSGCARLGPDVPTNDRTAAAATQTGAVIDASARHYFVLQAEHGTDADAIVLIPPPPAAPDPTGPDLSVLETTALDTSVPTDGVATSQDAVVDRVVAPPPVALAPDDLCLAAQRGTVQVAGQTFATRALPDQIDCELVDLTALTWTVASRDLGQGLNNRRRVPFESLACDFGNGPASQPWINGGYPSVGQELFIPDAIGTRLPDGSRHDGFFRCVDERMDLSGPQIAVFVGAASSVRAASRATPFRFARKMAGRNVQILVLP